MNEEQEQTTEEKEEKTVAKSKPSLVIRPSLRKTEEEHDSAPIWLISFTDVIALMLTFFVLLYAMSDTDPLRFNRKLGITEYAFGEYNGPQNNVGDQEGVNMNRENFEAGEDINYLRAVLEETLQKHDVMAFTTISQRGGDIILLFDIQNTDQRFLNFINELSPLLNNMNNRVSLVCSDETLFPAMQGLGQKMLERGYRKPLVLSNVEGLVKKESIGLLIQPHMGNRIE